MSKSADLDSNGIILIPDGTIMDPDIFTINIKAISVECCQIYDTMMVLISSTSTDFTIAYFWEKS